MIHTVNRLDVTMKSQPRGPLIRPPAIRFGSVGSVYRGIMRDWRKTRAVAVLVITLFLITQLVVPISRFGDDSAKRFGWQMFSEGYASPGFVVHTTEGADVEIPLGDYTAILRADVALTELIPPHLCTVVPDAASVTWQTGEYLC